ncbi:hypothetical protein EMIHUDRAFT_459770 [Emiliania huxleyi CCMP1516]|uniref:Uncharacterized protein n=2 Tax=Emiliania huxleyi TaxID=2903 RepID=A0A0D3IJM1_EMIH1|nr:hypothetical protein EMIHUDRAFT_459770 [Emiliania huxleyi CCMP1516]EOD11456.1 hypothetical protein EMIHUDRAFT_459770 [Emiliania huxleyi CCMP1516]|eukprot:XP_005763885.1 hypothetical protein EMIHUDRAFT_459770 [Emiliania huxleyi CCMP1516]
MGCSHSSATTTRTAKQSRSAKQSRAVCAGLPVVGILRCDGARWECAQAIVSAADRAEYHYRIVYAVVEGLPYQHVRAGKPLSASQEEALRVAVEELDSAGCVCITGDCGSFVHYQGAVRSLSAPSCCRHWCSQADLEQNLVAIGLEQDDAKRFIVVGLQHIRGFATADVADQEVSEWGLVDESVTTVERKAIITTVERKAKESNAKAIILESTLLPSFSDALRARLGLPVFDALTLVDYFVHASTDNPRFGLDFDERQAGRCSAYDGLDPAKLPAIGILRIDYEYPPALGDIACEKHPTRPSQVAEGLTFEVAQEGGPLCSEKRENVAAALQRLQATPGVVGIAGGPRLRSPKPTPKPKPKLASPGPAVLRKAPEQSARFLVLTANGAALEPKFAEMLALANVTEAEVQARFHVLGLEDVDGFDAVAKGEAVDTARVEPGIVALAKAAVARFPDVRAILLEYADALRSALGVQVFDAITLVDYVHSSTADNPHFGVKFQTTVPETPSTPSSTPWRKSSPTL